MCLAIAKQCAGAEINYYYMRCIYIFILATIHQMSGYAT